MPFNGDGCYSVVADNEEDFYLQIQRGVLFKMKLNAQGQVMAYNRMDPLDADTSDYDFINYLVMDPNDDDIIYFNNNTTLWRNNDASNYPYNNSQLRTNIGWDAFSDTSLGAISCMDVSTSPANTIYLGTQNSLVYRIDNANVGDPELVQLSNLGIGSNKYISAVEVDPTNADRVLVLASNYSTYSIVFTDNGGQSWKRVAGNLEDNIAGGGNGPSMRTAEIAVIGGDTLYIVGGSTGLYATDKLEGNDTEWTQIGTEIIGNVVVENIRYRESDGKLIVGTHGTGVYSTIITSIYDVLPDLVGIKEMDDNTKISIFPNPATDKAIVEWSNDIIINKIIVSDASGKIVLSQKTNKNSVQLQTSDLEKGIYFITLKGEQVEQTQKLVIN